jgi:hypothetical protein
MDLYYDGKPPSENSASSDKGILPGTVSEVIFSDWLRLHQILFSACDAKYKVIYMANMGGGQDPVVGWRNLVEFKKSSVYGNPAYLLKKLNGANHPEKLSYIMMARRQLDELKVLSINRPPTKELPLHYFTVKELGAMCLAISCI